MSSWIAAATSYSAHGVPMLPFYIFYSMFGFQRIGDLLWAAADSRARGFLLGATAGRTTLSGEGLQHQDGSSHLAASTIPICRAYDPAFRHELMVIVHDGMRRMLEAQEDVFHYITVMNENYAHPPMPPGAEAGIVRGMYRLRESPVAGAARRVQLLGSGAILREALAAAETLEREHGVAADVWSVTSWTELRWDGLVADGASPAVREVRGGTRPAKSWIEECLAPTAGAIVAASDYVSAVADLIRPWIPAGRRYVALGTDGFGRSDTRSNLRGFFGVDAAAIVAATLGNM
jgi:pyruvate dehydrogenase E1 component